MDQRENCSEAYGEFQNIENRNRLDMIKSGKRQRRLSEEKMEIALSPNKDSQREEGGFQNMLGVSIMKKEMRMLENICNLDGGLQIYYKYDYPLQE